MEETSKKTRRNRRKDGPLKKTGPKSAYNDSLGIGKKPGIRMPDKVALLFKEWNFKRLLNWMVMDASFKKKILDQVPEHDPPEPDKPAS